MAARGERRKKGKPNGRAKATKATSRGKRQGRKAVEQALAGPLRRPRAPRNPALPGMEGVRYEDLDSACEALSDIRAKMNDLRADEKGTMQMALSSMRSHKSSDRPQGVTTYRHSGMELVRVPGEEKLRVRSSKEQATAETEPDEDVDQEEADETRLEAEG